jgi:hypothetical protein
LMKIFCLCWTTSQTRIHRRADFAAGRIIND